MAHYIVIDNKGNYLTARKATGSMYRSRAGWSSSIDDARVFGTAGSAKNSANYTKYGKHETRKEEFKVIPVMLSIGHEEVPE